MDQTPTQKLSCPSCGKEFAWQPHLAGRRVACTCGTVFQAPAVPPPPVADAYDLIEEPPVASSLPAQPVLSYESKEVVKAERRRIRDRILEQWRIRDLWLPISLIVLGLACKLMVPLTHATDGGLRAAVVMGLVGLGTAFNVLVMLAAVMIAARLVDLDIASPIQTVVKLGLMFVLAASAGGLIANLAHFDGLGVAVGVHAVILLYWVLFALLFKAGLTETMMTIAIMGVLQAILNVGVWRL
ncbi:MAG: hypothetical protein ABSH20_08520 [Tepidisphaeraceae bacterium]|jgi:hypothetical protein